MKGAVAKPHRRMMHPPKALHLPWPSWHLASRTTVRWRPRYSCCTRWCIAQGGVLLKVVCCTKWCVAQGGVLHKVVYCTRWCVAQSGVLHKVVCCTRWCIVLHKVVCCVAQGGVLHKAVCLFTRGINCCFNVCFEDVPIPSWHHLLL